MHMKSFCAVRKHARGRPLLRPKSDLRQYSLVTPDKFTKSSAVTLGMDCARKNLYAGDPDTLYLRLGPVCHGQCARINTRMRDSFRQRARFIIARSERISRCIAHARPQICFAFIHVDLLKPLIRLTKNPLFCEKDSDYNRDRAPISPASVPGSLPPRVVPPCGGGWPIRGDIIWQRACKQ